MKRTVIASLATVLLLTACATETATDDIVTTTPETLETVETTVEVTVPTTEPTVEVEVEIETTAPTEPVVLPEPTIVPEATETVETTEQVELGLIYLGEFKLTAYCPCEQCNGQWAGGITSTGVMAKAGRTIAVDPKVIPYGTEVVINGHTYVAEDCGGAIKGNRIDVYFNTHSEALKFGVKYADVYIVGE